MQMKDKQKERVMDDKKGGFERARIGHLALQH